LGLSNIQRKWLMVQLDESVPVEEFFPSQAQTNYAADVIQIQVGLLRKNVSMQCTFDTDKMDLLFRKHFIDHVISVGQPMVMSMNGTNLLLTVHGMSNTNVADAKNSNAKPVPSEWGVMSKFTGLKFFAVSKITR
jgi:hypothetical protein